jgi:hypothetical protein
MVDFGSTGLKTAWMCGETANKPGPAVLTSIGGTDQASVATRCGGGSSGEESVTFNNRRHCVDQPRADRVVGATSRRLHDYIGPGQRGEVGFQRYHGSGFPARRSGSVGRERPSDLLADVIGTRCVGDRDGRDDAGDGVIAILSGGPAAKNGPRGRLDPRCRGEMGRARRPIQSDPLARPRTSAGGTSSVTILTPCGPGRSTRSEPRPAVSRPESVSHPHRDERRADRARRRPA